MTKASNPSLYVGQSTTLSELQKFAALAKTEDMRIIGKTDAKTGQVTLYLSDKAPSLLERVSGKAARQSEAAREAVMQLLDRHANAFHNDQSLPEDERKALSATLMDLKSRIDSDRGRSMRSPEFSGVAFIARTAERHLGVSKPAPPPLQITAPTLAELHPPQKLMKFAADKLGPLLSSGGDTSGVVKGLAATLATEMKAHAPDKAVDLALGDKTALKRELHGALAIHLDQVAQSVLSGPEGSRFLDAVVARLEREAQTFGAAPDRGVHEVKFKNKFGQDQSVKLPDLVRDGKRYVAVQKLGEGGFASVYKYQNAADPKDCFALKLFDDPKSLSNANDIKQDDINREIKMHADLVKGGQSPNLLGLHGLAKLPNGQLAMALEFAPGGDVMEMGRTIAKSIGDGPGKISAEQAKAIRLTLAHEMAKGLAQIHGHGKVHFDFKPPNALIDADGKIKISDFGTVENGPSVALNARHVKVDGSLWQSTELAMAVSNTLVGAHLGDARKLLKDGGWANDLKKAFPKADEDGIEVLMSDLARIGAAQAVTRAESAPIGQPHDVWALGASMVNIMTGEHFLQGTERGFLQVENFAKGSGAAIQPAVNGKLAPGALAKSTGDAAVDAYANGLLNRKPSARPTAQQAANNAIFNAPGVGSDEAHALIAALHKGDPQAIDAAKAALDKKLAPQPSNA